MTKCDTKNYIERVNQVIEVEKEKVVPIHSTIEKIVEVPHILEKIVEKIILIPQIVEIIKHVHEIVEESPLGVAVGVDVYTQEAKYKEIHGKVKAQFTLLLTELRKMKSTNPSIAGQITIIETFLAELDLLVGMPRIVQVEKEVNVEVEKKVPIVVPKMDEHLQKHQVTLSLIIHKLMGELLRIKQTNPNVKMDLDHELLRIFSGDLKYKEMLSGDIEINT